MATSSEDVVETKVIIDTSEALASLDSLSAKVQAVRDQINSLNGEPVISQDNVNTIDEGTAAMEEGTTAAEGFAGGINIVRVALGAVTAMLTFQVINAITSTFTNAIKYSDDYYESLVQISIAQDAMARGGVNTSQQQLLGIAQDLEKTWKNISDVDMVNAVAQSALLTTQYGFSNDQVKEFANLAAEGFSSGRVKDMNTAIDDLLKTLAGPTTAKWAADVGLAYTAVEQKAMAAKLGIQEVNGAFTDQQKAVIAIALDMQNWGMSADQIKQALGSIPGLGQQTQASWTNALTEMGKSFSPFLAEIEQALIPILQWLTNTLLPDMFNVWTVGTAMASGGLEALIQLMQGHIKTIQEFGKAWEDATNQVIAYDLKVASTGGVNTSANTPTAPGGPLGSQAGTPPGKLSASDIDAAIKDYQDYENTVEEDAQKFYLQMEQMQASYENSVTDEIENYHNSVAKAEMDFNLRMKELKQQYEYNLQGDLEDRNARKVLQDEAQYAMDKSKAQAEEKNKLAQLKMDENLRLEQLAQNYQLEKQKAQENYEEQQRELQIAEQQKLETIAENLGQQYNLTGEGVKAIYDLLNAYYGPNGYFDKLQDYSLQSMTQKSQELLNILQQMVAKYQQVAGGGGGGGGAQGPTTGNHPHAGGGVDFANVASSLTYGEAGPEVGLTLPLYPTSAPTQSSFNFGGGSGKGVAVIQVLLSDGLEASIIQNTLNEVATTLEKVSRSR